MTAGEKALIAAAAAAAAIAAAAAASAPRRPPAAAFPVGEQRFGYDDLHPHVALPEAAVHGRHPLYRRSDPGMLWFCDPPGDAAFMRPVT
jgi:hypothetical protein